MEIQKIRRGVIRVSFTDIDTENLNPQTLHELALTAFLKLGENPSLPLSVQAFAKGRTLLLFAEEKNAEGGSAGAGRRLMSFIMN